MYSHTKKVGSLGRYGPRIGRKLRNEIRKIENISKRNRCPYCGGKVRKKAVGIFECKSCSKRFTGGAYLTINEKVVKATMEESISKPEEVK